MAIFNFDPRSAIEQAKSAFIRISQTPNILQRIPQIPDVFAESQRRLNNFLPQFASQFRPPSPPQPPPFQEVTRKVESFLRPVVQRVSSLPQQFQAIPELARQTAKPVIQDFQQRVPRFQERLVEPVKKEVGQFVEFAQGKGQRAERFRQMPIARTTPEEMALGFTPMGVAKVTPTLRVATPQFIDAATHIKSRIGEPVKAYKFTVSGFLQNLKEKLVDSFSPIEDAINAAEKRGGFKLLPTQDPRLLRNRVLGATSIANQSLKRDLEPIIKQIGARGLDEFDSYLAARQALDVGERGFKTGIDTKKAQVFINALAPKYEQVAQQVTGYTQKVLKFVTDGGLISKELYNQLTKIYPRYVPLNRIFDIIEEGGLLTPKQVGSLAKQTVVQRLKGSERQITSPLASIIDKTYTAVNQVERNRVALAISRLRILPDLKDIIKPVTEAKGRNTISVFESGKKVFYEVPEGFEIAAKNLNYQQSNILIRALALPVRLARLGITGINIPFVATNFVRDQLFTILTSQNARKTSVANPYNWVKGFFDTIRGKGLYDDYLASGGGWAEFFRVGRQQGKMTLREFTRGVPEKVARTIVDPRQWLSTIENLVSRVGETPTRVQMYSGTLEALGAKGLKVEPLVAPTRESLLAVKAGREASVDFAKKGSYGEVLNSVFIYLNAGIQGSRTALRTIKTNPVGTSVKIATTLYMPIFVATLWNLSSENRARAYADIPEWEKQNFLIILPPNPELDETGRYSDAIKIPLPFNFSALGIPVRKGIEFLAGQDQLKLGDALAMILGFASPFDIKTDQPLASATSRLIPTAITPFVEAATNTKLFSGTPLVSRSLEKLEPSQQYYQDTPKIFVDLGQAFGVSPIILENFVRGYSGGTGQQVASLLSGDIRGATVEPFQKRFFQVRRGQQVERFYDELKKAETARVTAKRLVETRPDDIKTQKYVTDNLDEIVKAKKLRKVGDYLSDIRKKKEQIQKSNLDEGAKKRAITELNNLTQGLILVGLQFNAEAQLPQLPQ